MTIDNKSSVRNRILQQIQPIAFFTQTNRAPLSKVLNKTTIPKKKKATIKTLGKLANKNQIEIEGRNTQNSSKCKSGRNLHCAYVCD